MKIGAPRSIRPISPAENAPDEGPNAPEQGGRCAGTAMPLRRNGDAVSPERLPRCAGTRVRSGRGRRSSPPNRDADASRDRNARIDERLRFSPAWQERQIHFPLEDKGRSPDSSLSTAILRLKDIVFAFLASARAIAGQRGGLPWPLQEEFRVEDRQGRGRRRTIRKPPRPCFRDSRNRRGS